MHNKTIIRIKDISENTVSKHIAEHIRSNYLYPTLLECFRTGKEFILDMNNTNTYSTEYLRTLFSGIHTSYLDHFIEIKLDTDKWSKKRIYDTYTIQKNNNGDISDINGIAITILLYILLLITAIVMISHHFTIYTFYIFIFILARFIWVVYQSIRQLKLKI